MKRIYALMAIALMTIVTATAATKVLGTPQASVDRMYQYVKSMNPGSSFTREIAEEFYNQGVKYGIRGDIALCQSCVETGWFKYTGGTAVTPSDHNYCGLGVTTLGQKGCQFSTVAQGVSAQLQHLWAYATTASLPSGWTLVDPRFNYVNRGCAPYWESFGSGIWASGANYGSKILSIYNDMMAYTVGDPSITSSSNQLTFSAEQGATAPTKTVTITGKNLSSAIVYNSSSSAFKVTTSNWNDYTGGQMTITLDTSKSAGTYTGYIAVQSGSGSSLQRIQINCTATITAKAGEASIAVSPANVTLTAVEGSASPTATVTVTGANLTADMTYASSLSAITVTPSSNWNARTGGALTIKLDATKAGNYNGTVTLQSASTKATISVSGKITAAGSSDEGSVLDFKEIWNHSETSNDIDWENSVRNFDYANGKLYCVYNTSAIKIVDAQTGSQLGELSTTGISGGVVTLCDVCVHGGRIYASNLGNANSPLKVYMWENETSEPTLLLSTSELNDAARLGDCIDVYGTYPSNLWLTFANDDNTTTRIVQYNYRNGNWSNKCIKATSDGATSLGSGASTRASYTGEGFWIDGKSIQPTYLNASGVKQYSLGASDCTHGNDFATFSHNGSDYVLSANYLNKAATTYSDGIMRLYDVTSGWSSPVAKGDFPTNGLGTTRNTNTTGSLRINVNGTTVEAWILTTLQGMAYYRSGDLGSEDGGDDEGDGDNNNENAVLPTRFTTDWSYTAANGSQTTYMNPSNDYTRNMALKGDNLYVVKRSDSDVDIVIVDAQTGAQSGVLSSSGLAESNWKYSSVANMGGTIVASNLAFGATSTLKVYAWASDSATPTTLLETTNHGGRAGDLISVSGNINSGKIYFASNTGYEAKVYVYTVSNGSASATPEVITLKDASGNAYDLGGGFAVIEVKAQADGTFIATGKNGVPTVFSANGTFVKELDSTGVSGNVCGTSFSVFSHGKYQLAAATTYKTGVKQGFLNLINITDGWDKPQVIKSFDALSNNDNSNSTFVSTAIAKSNGSKIHLWVLIPKQGIAKYTASASTSVEEALAQGNGSLVYDGSAVYLANGENAYLQIVNAMGGVAASTTGARLETANLQSGIYVATSIDADGNRQSIKIAVK